MNQFERNKSMYSAGLAGNLAYRDSNNSPHSTASSTKKRILRDSSFSATGGDSAFSFQQQQQQQQGPRNSVRLANYQGSVILSNNLNDDDDDSDDWDSEPELEMARVQEAARLQRRVPSIKRSTNNPQAPQASQTPTSISSPYKCVEIGPQLDLGFQWPQQYVSSASRGFVRASRENTSLRQRQVDRLLLTRRQKHKNILLCMTVYLQDTFSTKNPKFAYAIEKRPKRVLTKPSKPVRNENHDNENYDYILKVGEILGQDPNYQYRVIDMLGQGTFGQVVKCERVSTGELFSVKVIKNKSAYKTQSCMEIEILKKLNKQLDPEDKHHILRLHYVFSHKHHLCLVFELLSYNLYDLIGHNQYRGFAAEKVRAFAVQILDTLCLLKDAKIIHCDLKPENILLENEKSLTLKVIDFGSSCHEANRIYTYIQSRFYRSPEILLGMRYTGAIDMWSFGCIVAELFLGIPLFPGSSEYNQLFRIVEMLGVPSKDMLSKGRNTNIYFNKKQTGPETFEYELKSREQYSQENNKNELPRKKYFPQTTLKDIILMFNNGKPKYSTEEEIRRASGAYYLSKEEDRQRETESRLCILDFLYGVLELNPLKRWTPQQAMQHPFITQKPYTGPFKPDGQINKPMSSISSSLANLSTSDKPKLLKSARRRAESMGKPTAPEQLQALAKQIQTPIAKYPKETHHSAKEQVPSDTYRQRNTRSQGDYVGLLPPPEAPSSSKTLKVKISPQIKVRRGSHDSVRSPPNEGQTVRSTFEGRPNANKFSSNVRKSHAGEAAGGFLMMRQQVDESKKYDPIPNPNSKKTSMMADAFKRSRK